MTSAPAPKSPMKMAWYAIALGVFVVVLAAIAVSRLGSDRDASGPPKVDQAATALPATIGRDAAIAVVLGKGDNTVGRVDRSDARLLTLEEYLAIAGPLRSAQGDPKSTPVSGTGFIGDPSKRYLWVVAISGEVWPIGRIPVRFGFPFTPPTPTPFPPYRWGLFLVDAVGASLFGTIEAGSDESWPAVFEKLPSHPASTFVPPSPTPALMPLAASLRSPEALSIILRRTSEVRRIDRIEVKLMTWGEYVGSAPVGSQPASAPATGPVWIYAVSGDILSTTSVSGGALQPVPWSIFAIDATTSAVTAFGATDATRWPEFFDRLPDHPRVGGQ